MFQLSLSSPSSSDDFWPFSSSSSLGNEWRGNGTPLRRFIKIDTGTALASSNCFPSGTLKTSIMDALSSLKARRSDHGWWWQTRQRDNWYILGFVFRIEPIDHAHCFSRMNLGKTCKLPRQVWTWPFRKIHCCHHLMAPAPFCIFHLLNFVWRLQSHPCTRDVPQWIDLGTLQQTGKQVIIQSRLLPHQVFVLLQAYLALVSIPIFGKEAGVDELFAVAVGLICDCSLYQRLDAFRFLRGALLFDDFLQAAIRESMV